MTVFAPLQYGWSVVYWLTVEGIPVVWTERATTLTLPTGFAAQDAALVIDKSAEVGGLVDRETGLGTGFSLSFGLLDTATVRTWFRKWSRQASITAAVAWNDATIDVDDTTGWDPAGGVFWLGLERVEYAGVTPSSFTGCNRGTAGTLASEHRPDSIGGTATDLPRWWRGRQVRLYASPVAPSGTMTGTALADEADEVWRGTLDTGPERDGAIWELGAQSLDRRMDLPLAAELTGRVVDSLPRFPVYPSQSFDLHLAGYNANAAAVKQWEFLIEVYPFASFAAGDLKSGSEQATAIQAAFAAALAGAKNFQTGAFDATSYFSSLHATAAALAGSWNWEIVLKAAAVPTGGRIASKVSFNGVDTPASETTVTVMGKAPVAGQHLSLHWGSNGNHLVATFHPGMVNIPAPVGVTVEFDAPPSSTLPTFGQVRIGDNFEAFYDSALVVGSLAFLGGLWIPPGSPGAGYVPTSGASVKILFSAGGAGPDVMRRLLSSSGTGQRGTYDSLGFGNGYGLDGTTGALSAVETGSFDALSAGPMTVLPVSVVTPGASFAECFGGLLALSQRAVVTRADDLLGARRQRLQLVSTEPGGSSWSVLITDEHVLSTSTDPVKLVRKADVPNIIRVSAPMGSDAPDRFAVQDVPAVAYQGAIEVEYDLPLVGKLTAEQVSQWALARFIPAQNEQVVELRLVPWLDVERGDLVRLELTHFAIWQWSTGTPGYTGQGRVLGAQRDLALGALVLSVLIDGTGSKASLCPAMEVSAWTGPAAAPTTIDVPRRFYAHLWQTLQTAGTGRFGLVHFEAGLGNEAGGGTLVVTNVADTGAVARLYFLSSAGVTLSSASWLTLPTLANGSDYQDAFAHVDDSTRWG